MSSTVHSTINSNINSTIDQAIDYLLGVAKDQNLELEVLGSHRQSTGVSFQNRKMDQFSFSETQQVGVRLLAGHNEGLAYSESLSKESLDTLVSEARANAKMIYREWTSELQAPSKALPEMRELYNPALEKVSVEQKISTAEKLESVAFAYDSRIANVTNARFGDSREQMWIANSKGLRGSYKMNVCYIYAGCLAKDGDNNVMDFEYESHQDFHDINPQRVAERAAQKTLARMGAERPKTGLYTVVFENRVAENLLGLIANYFSAKAIDEKTSPLDGQLGKSIFSRSLTVIDDPFFRHGHASRPFDDEGYPSQKTVLIENGKLCSFLTNSVMARKLKLPHTASASRSPASDLDVHPSNMVIKPGTHSFDNLLNSDSQVILVTQIMGTAGFRSTSGDFSIPMEGHLYENGQRVRPLKDFLISGNILQLFASLEGIGNDALSPIGNTICPSLLVRGLNIAGR